MPDVQLTTPGSSNDSFGIVGVTPYLGPWVVGGVIFFLIQSKQATGSQNTIRFNYSSDNGATWTVGTSLNGASLGKTVINDCCAGRDMFSDRIYVVIHCDGQAPTSAILVRYFDTGDLQWHNISNQPTIVKSTSPCDGSQVPNQQAISIAVDPSTGDLAIAYTWGVSPAFFCTPSGICIYNTRTQYSDFIGGVWGSQTNIPNQETTPQGTNIHVSQIVRSPSGLLHFILYSVNAPPNCGSGLIPQSPLYHIGRTGIGGTWGSFQTISSAVPFPDGNSLFPAGLGVVAGGEIIVPQVSGSNPSGTVGSGIFNMVLNVLRGADVLNPTWTTEIVDSNISNGDDHNVPGFQNVQAQEPIAAVSPDGTTIFYVSTTSTSGGFNNPASGDIRRSVYSSGVWQAFTTYRTFANPLVPTGVYPINNNAVIYLRVNGVGGANRDNWLHFYGAPDTGTLTLIKAVSSGPLSPVAWTLSADGPTTLTGPGPTVTGDIDPGDYALSESFIAGYRSRGYTCVGGTQVGQSVTIAAGDTVVCTIVNDPVDKLGGRAFIKVTPNRFDACLGREYRLFQNIDRYLLSCNKKPDCFNIPEREWGMDDAEEIPTGPPPGAITLNPNGSTPLPTAIAGDVTIFSFRVPIGYDGIILGQFHGYVYSPVGPGSNFVEGSGDIIWRISINVSRYARDCGAMLVSLGSIRSESPIPGGIWLKSGDLVRYIVNAPNLSGSLNPGQGSILAGCHGYFWPRK